MAKSPSPISREQFSSHAEVIRVQVNGDTLLATPKQFSTGSFGWYVSGKAHITVDGIVCPVQVGMNMTVVGSNMVG